MNSIHGQRSRKMLDAKRERAELPTSVIAPPPLIDSILRLMTVWRITEKIIRTAITVTHAYS